MYQSLDEQPVSASVVPLPPQALLVAWLGVFAGMGWLGIEGNRLGSVAAPFDAATLEGMFHAVMTVFAALGAVAGLGILKRREWARRVGCMVPTAVAVAIALFGLLDALQLQGEPAALAQARRDAIGNALIAAGIAAFIVWSLNARQTRMAMVATG